MHGKTTIKKNKACKCVFPDRRMKITKYFIRINAWSSERIGSCQLLPSYETHCGSYEQVSVFRHHSETLNFAPFLCVVSQLTVWVLKWRHAIFLGFLNITGMKLNLQKAITRQQDVPCGA
jgi:hypothetical protein